MASAIIEKIPNREVGKGKDNEVIELSWTQSTPGDAKAEDFIVLQPGEAETPSHGQCGKTESEYRKLLQKSAAVKGKSPFRSKPE
jgi:hypothetical protein